MRDGSPELEKSRIVSAIQSCSEVTEPVALEQAFQRGRVGCGHAGPPLEWTPYEDRPKAERNKSPLVV